MAVRLSTTVLVPATAAAPAGPYDLTTLAVVHTELDIPATDTTKDSFLQRAITQASRAICAYCNRVFAVELVQDVAQLQQDPYLWQTPGGVSPLQLSRWPIAGDPPITVTGNTANSSVVTGLASTTGISQGDPAFASDGSIPPGTTVQSVLPGTLVLTNATTGATQGLSITTGMQVLQTLSVGVTQALVYGTDYAIDADRGSLLRLNAYTGASVRWEAEPTTVTYLAGYSAVPPDVEEACLRLVTARFRARGRDPTLLERSQTGNLGTERFWVGNRPGQVAGIPPEVAGLVEPYRVPVAL